MTDGVITSHSTRQLSELKIPDTRAAEKTPNEYTDQHLSLDFTDEFGSLGSWYSGITLKGWTGTYAAWQLISEADSGIGDTNLYFRQGNNTTWQSMRTVWTSANFANNSSNWNTAYGWGDHASAGYITGYSEVDTLATVTSRGSSTTNDISVGDFFATHQSADDATTKAEMLSYAVAKFRPHSTNSGTLAIAQVDGGNSVGLQFTNGAGSANWDMSLQPFGGNVGINKINPSGALHVYSGTSERFLISGDVHVQGSTDLNINGTSRRLSFNSGTGTIRTTTANNLILKNDSTTALTIDVKQKTSFAGDITILEDLYATNQNLKFHAGGTHVMNIDVNGKVYPATHNAYDLGHSASLAWRNLYLSGTVTASGGNSSQWNTAYGWGDHSQAGYIY